MSDSWSHSVVEGEFTGQPREFFVSAELFVSTAAGAALPKPPIPRKKGDKRDSAKQLNSNVDEKKLKEKSSWLSSSKSSSGGHWRSATCKLFEEGERCFLNIYVDESILYQTLYIHLLNHTDIRPADMSLFLRKDCLAINCVAGKRWAISNNTEPVYLQFSNADASNTWLALLRSYALPEIYGRRFFPADGGSYRMWRQVELTILSGRNLGNSKPFERVPDAFDDGAESTSELDHVDLDVFCEINLNNTLCARTTKKGIGSPEWHESFTFPDLPPFDNLDVIVWREKKLFKPTLLGVVRIALSNFRRSEAVEGWFPVLQSGPVASDLQVGEIRMRIRVDEEIILPSSSYSKLLKTFNSRNFLDWLSEFESKLKLKSAASQLMLIAKANDTLIEQVQDFATKEVDLSQSSHQTLFRGNTVFTKIMELCMNWYGKPFLEASIGTVVRRLCTEQVAIEVNPMRSGKSSKDVERNVERNVDLLKYWCQEFWDQIYSVREECPPELRRLFGTIRELVEKHYPHNDSFQDKRELRWQSVSAFCFLRFIVPAILNPHLSGLYPGLPSDPVKRSLTLIAKVIQSLANLNANSQKEEFIKDFLSERVPTMIDYIIVVSSTKEIRVTTAGSTPKRQERLHVVHALRERAATMPVLYKESIPMLPHSLDIPRQLAIITSAVIRHSRSYFRESKVNEQDSSLQELCSRCFAVEEQALLRVSQLAAQLSAHQRQQHPPGNRGQYEQYPPSPVPPLPPSPRSTSSARSGRPSTAPSPSDPNGSRQQMFFEPPVNSTRTFVRVGDGTLPSNPSSPIIAQSKNKLLHLKSTSTDSISSYVNQNSSVTMVDPFKTDSFLDDDPARRKKRLLRGIWRR